MIPLNVSHYYYPTDNIIGNPTDNIIGDPIKRFLQL